MAYELEVRENVYTGRAFHVTRDTIRLPNGETSRLDIVHHPPAVTLVPVNDQGEIIFIRQYRHSSLAVMLELPAGVMEAGEAPEYSAGREIREETGFAADEIRPIGEFFLVPGYSTEYMYIFLATGLHHDPLQKDEDEFIEIEPIAIAEAYAMAEAGQIQDAKTLSALLLARPHLMK